MHSWHVGSPGLGITEPMLSVEPLATEGEATPGPDDYNPLDEAEAELEREELDAADGAVDFGGFGAFPDYEPRSDLEF